MAEKWEHCGIPAGDDGGGPNRDHIKPSYTFSGMYPEGRWRVLVFDEDPQSLHILEEHLQEFQYEVTGCHEEERAMYLLRNHRNRFDIAIVDAQNSDGDRFRFISEIGSEMDLPIIIISKDDSVDSVTNWMRNGACDYLLKPIRPEDLRLIFKHVVKRMQVTRSVAVAGEAGEKATGEKSSSVGDSSIRNPNKRKRSLFLDGQANQEAQTHERGSTTKKRRVVWDEKLHSQFMEAVDDLGRDKAVPKKILERMNVDGITRENVASHLQKFRMNQKKQEDDQNKRYERNLSLVTPPEGGMYNGDGSSEFYRGRNVQFPTHQINNIPQPSSVQQLSTNPNLRTQFIPQIRHHHDDIVSVAVSGRNLVMNHQHHHPHLHPHQMSACIDQSAEESVFYNEDVTDISNMTNSWFRPQTLEEVSLLPLQDPVMTTTMLPNDSQLSIYPQQVMHVHEPSMVQMPLFPSSLTHSSFLDQKETITMVNVREQQWK